MTRDLADLRKIAERATPGPWTLEYENADDWEAGINDGDYPHTIHGPRNCSFDNWVDKSKIQDSLNRVTEISEMVDADAEFIATFDPPTVLALLARLEQAERSREQYVAHYEAATLALHRVWDLIPDDPDIRKMFVINAEDVSRALVGEPNE